MDKHKISIIVAVGKNLENKSVIGKSNELLWRISDDLKRFKSLTVGHPIIMGRKTFESIGRPLPERKNIVITRSIDWQHDGVEVAHSIEEALEKAGSDEEIFIIGGAEIYKQSLHLVDRLYLTLVEDIKEGDSFFPEWTDFKKELHRERRFDDKTGLHYTWLTLEREV